MIRICDKNWIYVIFYIWKIKNASEKMLANLCGIVVLYTSREDLRRESWKSNRLENREVEKMAKETLNPFEIAQKQIKSACDKLNADPAV